MIVYIAQTLPFIFEFDLRIIFFIRLKYYKDQYILLLAIVFLLRYYWKLVKYFCYVLL
jgi:hypothetical protein